MRILIYLIGLKKIILNILSHRNMFDHIGQSKIFKILDTCFHVILDQVDFLNKFVNCVFEFDANEFYEKSQVEILNLIRNQLANMSNKSSVLKNVFDNVLNFDEVTKSIAFDLILKWFNVN